MYANVQYTRLNLKFSGKQVRHSSNGCFSVEIIPSERIRASKKNINNYNKLIQK